MSEELTNELIAAIGERYVTAGPEIGDHYRVDVLHKFHASPAYLVKPASTQEVSEVVKLAGRHGLSVTVVGGHTGTSGGAITRDGGIALSLERMNAIEDIDTASMTMTVGAGCILQLAQEAAEAKGGFLPLDLGSRGSATIGGTIASNAGGNRVLRWGMMRDMVLGLEVVLGDGTIVSSMTRMIKDNAGYAWKQLIVGSEGTLGIVTRAVLRLRPKPVTDQTALVALASFDDAIRLLRDLEVKFSGQLSSFELMWADFYDLMTEMQLSSRPRPMPTGHAFYALVERLGGDPAIDPEQFERVLMEEVEAGVVADAVIASSGRERHALWAVREEMQPALATLNPFTVYDIGMALGVMPGLVSDVKASISARFPDARMIFYGHAGDGNLHLVVHVGPDGKSHEAEVDRLVFEAVRKVEGSIAAEHGVGMSRLPFIGMSRNPAELEVMRRLKAALDPGNVLNPGKLVA